MHHTPKLKQGTWIFRPPCFSALISSIHFVHSLQSPPAALCSLFPVSAILPVITPLFLNLNSMPTSLVLTQYVFVLLSLTPASTHVGKIKRIHLLPNPARFTVNGISFGITSVDTLFHLRKEEYFKRGTEFSPLPAAADDLPNDAMANLCRHLLLQRRSACSLLFG